MRVINEVKEVRLPCRSCGAELGVTIEDVLVGHRGEKVYVICPRCMEDVCAKEVVKFYWRDNPKFKEARL